MLVQLYGQFGGENSNAIVSRGIACALHRANIDVQIYDPVGVYNGLWEDLPTGLTPSAEVGIAVGYPPETVQFLMGHGVKVGCFIAESSVIPHDWGAIAAACDIVAVPSAWCAAAFVAAGVSPRQLLVMPHGLNPVYSRACHQAFPGTNKMIFLHVAAAPAFRERKGTIQLIEAFGELAGDTACNVSLMLRCGSTDPDLVEAIRRTGHDECFLITEDGPLQPAAMREFYCQGYVALVLPSRAEAYGLCALEARSLGLPVILTHAAGHAAHAEAWDTVIRSWPDAPCRVNGIPGGLAPQVLAGDVYTALREFIAHAKSRWDWAQHGSSGYYDRNTWEKATRVLVAKLKGYRKRPSRPGIGL